MNKKFLLAAMLLPGLFACNNQTTEKTSPAATAQETVELPMKMSYQGKSSIGSNQNLLTVMKWNKFLSEKNIDSAATLLADSVAVSLSDGTTFNTTKDSVKAIVSGYLTPMKSISIKYVSALPVNVEMDTKVTDEWVLSWTDEEYTYGDGKNEHNVYHEDYRLVNGKIRQVLQYARKVAAPPAAPEKK